jgi:signal transduction histidine kinase
LSNAVKFTEKGKIIFRISVDEFIGENNAKIKFSIKDTGIGIKQKNKNKIFEAFAQEDATTNKRFGGTGLGLSISNQLLGLMDSSNSIVNLEKEVTFILALLLNILISKKIKHHKIKRFQKKIMLMK